MADIFGEALLDYQRGMYTEDIGTFSSLGDEDSIPVPYLFRDYGDMPNLEKQALNMATGKVLDIGSGSGSHSLYLQEKGFEVTALDSSPGAVEVCQLRGVKSFVCSTILEYHLDRYDTLLLLMNGIGLAGNIVSLEGFLLHLKKLLKPNGQILLDSSNIIYMFDQDEDSGIWIPGDKEYYGEVTFQMTYKGRKSAPFEWLYIDFETLSEYCEKVNLSYELVISGDHYDYLAKLSPKRE